LPPSKNIFTVDAIKIFTLKLELDPDYKGNREAKHSSLNLTSCKLHLLHLHSPNEIQTPRRNVFTRDATKILTKGSSLEDLVKFEYEGNDKKAYLT